ncbi:MAG: shikimate dehydrogenase [Elusimicrobia bacterium]|nr:shikimate dehydrogenase [Elusimicrobiota bacterium]
MKPPWTAVIGFPVAHSLSPAIFRLFARDLGRPVRYRAIPVPPESLAEALRRARTRPWLGWNVTMPHKTAAARLLDRLHPSAQAAGAVNVVHFQGGRAMGYNTDADGFLAPLVRRGIGLAGRTAVVFGAGGAAAAVCEALKRSAAARLVVADRTPSKAAALARRFGAEAASLEPAAVAVALAGADILVNATSAGEAALLPPGLRLKAGAWACDLAYRPSRTRFMTDARAAGAEVLGGIEMLAAQAALTWSIWFGEAVPDRVVESAVEELRRVP